MKIVHRLTDFLANYRSGFSNPAAWLVDSLATQKSLSGVNVDETTALNASCVWDAVQVLANTVATLPRHVYERTPDGGRIKAVDHPAYSTIHSRPNPKMTAFSFFHSSMVDLLLNGNCYALVARSRNGKAIQLYRLQASRVTPRWGPDEQIIYEVRNDANEKLIYQADEIVHIPGLGFDGIAGRSVLSHARESIGTAIAAEKYAGATFGNQALPTIFLKHPGRLNEEGRRNLRSSLERMHKGVEKAGKFGLLEEGLDVSTIQINHRDLQFLETRQFSVIEIARWFNLPPHKLKDLSRATYSNITEQEMMFITDSVLPWLRRFEEVLSWRLLGDQWPRRYYIEWAVQGRLRGTTPERYQAYATARQWGWLSVNDIRELENLNPVEGGDEYLVPMNMRPAGEELAAPEPEAQPEVPEEGDQNNESERYDSLRQSITEAFVPTLADPISRMLRKEKRAIAKAVKRNDFAHWLDEFYEDQERYVRAAVGPVIDSYVIAIYSTFDLGDPPDSLAELAGEIAADIARRHIEASRLFLDTSPDPLQSWPD